MILCSGVQNNHKIALRRAYLSKNSPGLPVMMLTIGYIGVQQHLNAYDGRA
jgi:hypothetical protein